MSLATQTELVKLINSGTTELELNGRKINDDGVEIIEEALRKNKLVSISLCNNGLSKDNIKTLKEAIDWNTSLTSITIQGKTK